MSLTRKQLLIRTGAAAAWVGAGGVVLADRMGAFDAPPPFDRGSFPPPSSSAVAVLKAETYDGDLEGIVLEGLRLVDADVLRRSVVLKPNLVEFFHRSSVNTDPRVVVAAANALRRLGASSVTVAEGPGHRRDTEAVVVASGLREAVDDSLAHSAEEQITEIDLLQDHLHDDVAEFVYERLKRRPMILPVVVEV